MSETNARRPQAPLLASCKELRDALAGAMRVIADANDLTVMVRFIAEMKRIGIRDGIGVRADLAIREAEDAEVSHVR